MIIYNGLSSDDLGLCVKSKEIPIPVEKTATETVPYMSGAWVFPQGEYEPITIKYTFDVIADNKRDLNAQKSSLARWANVISADLRLYDTDISAENYFIVYSSKASWGEDDLQGLFSVEFLCYPFILQEYSQSFELHRTPEVNFEFITFDNTDGARPIVPKITTSGSISIKVRQDETVTLTAGTYVGTFQVPAGESLNVRFHATVNQSINVTAEWKTEGYA